MEQAAFDNGSDRTYVTSMEAMPFLPEVTRRYAANTAGTKTYWQQLKSCLQDYFKSDKEQVGYTRMVAYHTHKFIRSLQLLPKFRHQLETAILESSYNYSWPRWRFAFDNIMEAELVTVFGQQPTPLHSYDGPAGIVYVLDGELTVRRYTEINTEISACSGISKLNCRKINRYRSSQGTLIDSISAPIVEMEANTERCVFLNIHLIDLPEHPHYFYYPSYISTENRQFFTRRVACEW